MSLYNIYISQSPSLNNNEIKIELSNINTYIHTPEHSSNENGNGIENIKYTQ